MKTYSECKIKTFDYLIKLMILHDEEKMFIDLFNQYAFCYNVIYDLSKKRITKHHQCENYDVFIPYFERKIIPIYIKEHGL